MAVFCFLLSAFCFADFAWAVDGDGQAPCWRGQAGTTRQTWRFDADTNPLSPEVVSNGAGSPQATVVLNAFAFGWYDTACLALGACDPDPYGTAQGFWDLGGTNASTGSALPGTVWLNIPNSVSAGATRYLWVQVTAWIESGVATYPSYVISNAVQVGSAVNVEAEAGPVGGSWYNQRTLWSVAGTTASNNLVLQAGLNGTILDTVTVDTLLRSAAVDDVASTPQNTATNLTATVLANDGGPVLSVVGASSPTAAGGTTSVGSGNVTYTPPANYTGPDVFYYTNSDCAGGLAAAQVTVTVTGAGGPAVNADTITRTQGLPLHIAKADLLVNDTGTAITFAGLNLTSTNGVTMTTNATMIFYTNPNNVADRLTYYIQDNASARAGGYVLIQVTNATSSSVVVQLQTGVPGAGTNTLTLAGIPNYQYVVQATTNVDTGPWWNLTTNPAGANGLWTVQDSTATNAQRYYRVSTP